MIVGIDLGTTNSEIAVVRQGQPQLLGGADRIMPSVVGIGGDGGLLVGRPARHQLVAAPERTVRSIKRKMGTADTVPLGDRTLRPEEISACILRRLVEMAGQGDIHQAVITVPAWFDEAQREATRRAGQIAGLEVLRLLNEPTAAALAYGLGRSTDEMLLVYDLGGGTFDVSIVESCGGVTEVRASRGDVALGGDDWDMRLAEWLAQRFEKAHGINLLDDARGRARVLEAAEKAKCTLSTQPFVRIREEFVAQAKGGALHLDDEVSRQEFEAMTADLLERTRSCIQQALSDARLEAGQVTHVLLAGGSTRMPAVHALVRQMLGQEPMNFVSPDEVVALGAAVQAAILEGQEVEAVLVDIASHSLGVQTAEMGRYGDLKRDRYSVLIPRLSALPARRSEVYEALHPEQEAFRIKVFQGEDPVASKNRYLGEVLLELPTHREWPELVVEFGLNLDGQLEVAAVHRESGRRERVSLRVELDGQGLDVAASQATLKSLVARPEQPPVSGPALSPEHQALLQMARSATDAGVQAAARAFQAAVEGGDDEAIETTAVALEDALFAAEV